MSYKSDKIVIVGGGSSGWMTAATLVKCFPNKDITVVESNLIPTIGVGESTLLEFNDWLRYLDIDIKEFMVATEASFKFGIGFTNFVEEVDKTKYYIFGQPDLKDTWNGMNDWYLLKLKNINLENKDFVDYYYKHSYAASIGVNKIPYEKSEHLYPFEFLKDTAFQVNAIKFAEWLRENYCIPKGVKRIVSTVSSSIEKEEGIDYLILSDGFKLSADLFVDCSGFKSILLGKVMKPEFIHTKNLLPNNKAWFGPIKYTDKEKELELITNCTGLKNGWVWNTPLWSRIGSGYVYCDEYIDDDSALEEFKTHLNSKNMIVYNPNRTDDMEFKKIEIKNGYYKIPWIKNVVAIGLSHGFLEPMESTGLKFIHSAALALCKSLNTKKHTQFDIDIFNNEMTNSYESAFNFVSLHYSLSKRDDSPYWNYLTSQKQSKEIHQEVKESFGKNLSQIYVNWGYIARTNLHFQHIQKEYPYDIYQNIEIFEKIRRKKIQNAKQYIDSCPTHYQYLKEYIYNE
ncbi:MAG: hypothetical protein EBT24_12110 [Betaproteobacteria bacterium]|nr:hypothetical protein [Betaproteobacteria bacterium]